MKLTNQTVVEPDLFEAGITAATDTDPETEYTLHLTVADNNMGVLLAKIIYYIDEEHREYETLESAELTPGASEISLNFTAPADSVWLLICRPAEEGIDAKGKTLTVISATMYKYNWTVSQLFVGNIGLQLNPYRFSYNGQERMDEKAGRANHYTAKFWEYDARKVMRENQDPKRNMSLSPYTVFFNNPIQFSDPSGDIINFKGYKDEINAPMTNTEAKELWNAMVKYLQDNGLGNEINTLIKSSTVYDINFVTGGKSFVGAYDVKGNYTNTNPYINFNPYQAVKTRKGYLLSPIEGLNHEIGHAFEYDKDPCIELQNSLTPDDEYGTKIERIIIRGVEQKAAEKIGVNYEGTTRNDHGGSPIRVNNWKPGGGEGGELPPKSKGKSEKSSGAKIEEVKLNTGTTGDEDRGIKTISANSN